MPPFMNTYGISSLLWENYSVDWLFAKDPDGNLLVRTREVQRVIKTALKITNLCLLILEWVPGASVASGLGRIAFGALFCALALARRMRNYRYQRPDGPWLLDETILTGISQIARGAIELIPFTCVVRRVVTWIPFGSVLNAVLDGSSVILDGCFRTISIVLIDLNQRVVPRDPDGRPNPNELGYERPQIVLVAEEHQEGPS